MARLFGSGAISVNISHRLALEQAPEAFAVMLKRQVGGWCCMAGCSQRHECMGSSGPACGQACRSLPASKAPASLPT